LDETCTRSLLLLLLQSPNCRFVIGEVATALLSIHELGLSFNDLKPENLLITALGHIKVAPPSREPMSNL
jgi:serine/threonine protein kinase